MRTTEYKKLDHQFIDRWSPRAFSNAPIPDEDLKTIFEAARWSPSCFNEQPWLYVYAQTPEARKKFLETLVEFNQEWACHAPVLIMVFAKKTFDRTGKENRWASFDVGASWMALTLQARKLGYITHGMGGFDETKAFEVAGIDPTRYDVMAVIALGQEGKKEDLSAILQDQEKPSSRNSLSTIIVEKL